MPGSCQARLGSRFNKWVNSASYFDAAPKRDSRRDKFAEVLKKAMHTRLGSDSEEVAKELGKHGIPQHYIKDALEIARAQGGFTIFALVDALGD